MPRLFLVIAASILMMSSALAGTVKPRKDWVSTDTRYSFSQLSERLEAAIKAEKMGLVTSASASEGAKAAGITIPGNRVLGVYRNDFARRMLTASVAAGIEAPIRFYVTENPGGTATLSYRKPSAVFEPYYDEGGSALKTLAAELDTIFAKIASAAAKEN